ncbi:sulfate transporter [Sphingomonas sp. Leaf407]|uniref:DUF3164 family protein n=1 Tax=unclassified Sphingomonas TaxID=196159 RepID=UPI0006F3ED5F|nr:MULTISPECIES: DUF3164 family protein [unclassified Sphingomonas]KQN37018.1 sulfate transporter [Sphingomonas sp. Leaf42]KQT30445.1 sulfate transporter [Sphingomonas sp. Leaf407]
MTEKRPPAAIDVGGRLYLRDAKGNLVPLEAVKAADLLIDETVRCVLVRARELSAAIAAFKADTSDQVQALLELLAQQYGAPMGGKKGNLTLTTFDGCEQLKVQVSDQFEFGPELQAAKALIDECLKEWASDGRPEIRAIVNRAFSVEKEGHIDRAAMFLLLRVEITDARWRRAMDAIRDSMRVTGSKVYTRLYERPTGDGAWKGVTLDMASA